MNIGGFEVQLRVFGIEIEQGAGEFGGGVCISVKLIKHALRCYHNIVRHTFGLELVEARTVEGVKYILVIILGHHSSYVCLLGEVVAESL